MDADVGYCQSPSCQSVKSEAEGPIAIKEYREVSGGLGMEFITKVQSTNKSSSHRWNVSSTMGLFSMQPGTITALSVD